MPIPSQALEADLSLATNPMWRLHGAYSNILVVYMMDFAP